MIPNDKAPQFPKLPLSGVEEEEEEEEEESLTITNGKGGQITSRKPKQQAPYTVLMMATRVVTLIKGISLWLLQASHISFHPGTGLRESTLPLSSKQALQSTSRLYSACSSPADIG